MRVPPRRALAVVVGGLAAAAFVGLAFAGGTDRSDERMPSAATASTTTTTERAGDDDGATATTSGRGIGSATTTSSPPDFVAEPIADRKALLVTSTETVVVDLAANTIERVAHSRPISQNYGSTIVTSGDVAFLLAHRQLYVVPARASRPLRDIGTALLLFGSATPGRAWVARESRGGFVLEEIDAEGATVRTTPQLPADASPSAVLGDRVVLASPEGTVVLWNWRTGRNDWTSPPNSHVVAAAGARVVWQRSCASPLCLLHVLDATTLVDATIPSVVDGTEFYPDNQLVSPSGRYLATMVGTQDVGGPPFRLRIIDLETGLMSESEAFEPARLLWSPDEKWLFVGGDGNPMRPLRWAYRVDGLDVRRVDIRIPAEFDAMAVAIV